VKGSLLSFNCEEDGFKILFVGIEDPYGFYFDLEIAYVKFIVDVRFKFDRFLIGDINCTKGFLDD
jgi:hypothetical protein